MVTESAELGNELDLEDRTIELGAQECARCRPIVDGAPDRVELWSRLDAVSAWLGQVEKQLLEPEPRTAKASEWFLDNEYLIQRAILQIQEDLPWSFYRQLPACVGEDEARPPRILVIARTLLGVSQLQISDSTVMRFIESYQTVTPLTIAELWALPTALRIACLETLLGALERLLPSLPAVFAEPLSSPRMPEDTETMARAFGNLRVVASISWKDVFEALSRVEGILRNDPAGVYERMDFETADRYRQTVERLARATPHSEIDVAERAVAQARRFAGSDVLRGHVGYWLVDAGQDEFSASLSYRVPVRRRLERWLLRHGVWSYGIALGLAMLAFLWLPAAYLASFDVGPAIRLLGLAVVALPASVLGVTVLHWLITLLLPPHVLAKLDFERAIPHEFKTVVAIPSLAGSEAEVAALLERLEEHYLGNSDAAAEFVLLTDFPDAPEQTMPGDDAILEALVAGVKGLNGRYAEPNGGPFHVLHRPRRLNPSEGCWMAWERKRGKLEEFNRFLRGDLATRFSLHVGDAARLAGTRFVVTLDADTVMPRGAVARLAGILAHPFNRARFDEETGRVVRGYTVVQPRIEVEPEA